MAYRFSERRKGVSGVSEEDVRNKTKDRWLKDLQIPTSGRSPL
jgi:hypothetical protein